MDVNALSKLGLWKKLTHKYIKLDHNKNDQYNRHVIYSVAKIAAKYALKLRASNMNIDYIYVLHSHVMGEDDDKDSLQVTLQKLVNEEDLIFSSGEQFFDVISLSDCSLGYYLICQKENQMRSIGLLR